MKTLYEDYELQILLGIEITEEQYFIVQKKNMSILNMPLSNPYRWVSTIKNNVDKNYPYIVGYVLQSGIYFKKTDIDNLTLPILTNIDYEFDKLCRECMANILADILNVSKEELDFNYHMYIKYLHQTIEE